MTVGVEIFELADPESPASGWSEIQTANGSTVVTGGSAMILREHARFHYPMATHGAQGDPGDAMPPSEGRDPEGPTRAEDLERMIALATTFVKQHVGEGDGPTTVMIVVQP